MKLSVVISTFNRKGVLKKILRRFEKQTDRDFEVIVVSDGSVDGTHEWLEDYKKKTPLDLQWFDTGLTDRYGLAIARNTGIRNSKGEAVVIMDDDGFPVKDFVKEHKKTVKRKVLTGGGLSHTDPYSNRKTQMREYLEIYGDSTPKEFTPFKKHKHKYVVENNTCMYKEDWLDNLFDESVNEYGVIAYGFLDKLKDKGYLYQFNPRAKILHKDEFKRSYGNRKKDPHTIPVWLKRVVYPIKVRIKKHAPNFYNKLKKIIGRSI